MTGAGRATPLGRFGSAVYGVVVAGAAAAAALAFGTGDLPARGQWLDFAALAAAAAVSQVLIVRTGRGHGFHTAIAFVAAGAILLPPSLLVAMIVVQHVPEWLKERYPWFIQSFNIANFTLGACGAWIAAHAIVGDGRALASPGSRAALAGLAAAVVFVTVNHVLLAVMLRTSRGLGLAESGLFSIDSLAIDVGLALFGVAIAGLWTDNPWLLPALLAPLALVHRFFGLLGQLRDSEQRFRTLFDAAPLGMIVRDPRGDLLSTNRALTAMVGEGRDPRTLLDADDARRQLELDAEVLAGDRDGYTLEQRYRVTPGEVVYGQVDVALVRDAGERPQFLLSMIQDVTTRKRLETELAQAQKMEAIGRLAGGVAHDFNNLLTAISGYADLAQHRIGDGDPALAADIAEIVKAAERAHQVTRQLLAFGRKQIMEPQVVSLNDVVGNADTMLRRLIGEHIEVVTAYGSGLGRVLADPGQLNQVIVNLVVNARDEMPEGGTLTIETANRTVSDAEARRRGGDFRPGSFVTLSVRDTGRGMDAATKARLFEPFFTRKEVGKGTGLGLSTVYGIVDQSGGFVEVQSEPELGATFTVYLPSLGAGAGADAEPPELQAEPAREATPTGSESILLVEDEEAVRRYVEAVLLDTGYRVVAAPDGAAALDHARRESFDLLLTDLIMPKLGGEELALRLGLPVVFMSGYSGALVERRGETELGRRLLQKPFSAAELRRQVRGALDASAGTRPAGTGSVGGSRRSPTR